MFERAERERKVDKAEFKRRESGLRLGLLQVQQRLLRADFPVIVLVSGVDGAGKGTTVNLLNEWMDPRYLRTHAFDDPGEEERERPSYWRYWLSLPPKGRIGLYLGSWYSDPIARRVRGAIGDSQLDAALSRVRSFEQTLADGGAVFIKLWLHLDKSTQRRRLESLASDPETAWRVTARDREHLELYDTFHDVAEHTLRETDSREAPWFVVAAQDERHRDLTAVQHVRQRIETALLGARPCRRGTRPERSDAQRNVLGALDLSRALPKHDYKRQLRSCRERLGKMARAARKKKRSSILVFEGWDAAGKGGIIRRIVPALDARNYQVIAVAAPTDEERARHYLWRFWRHIPRAGKTTIYDRSWYGRVLVERVEGFAHQGEWRRAYAEINDFEQQLTDHGIVLLKFWVHISKEEQLRRFEQREKVPWKRHKISAEDYRNREKWDEYVAAANDMVEYTGTGHAPWTLLEGEDKRHARIRAIQVFCERLEEALDEARRN